MISFLLFLLDQSPVLSREAGLDQCYSQFNAADNDNESRSNCSKAGMPPADVSPTTDLLSAVVLRYVSFAFHKSCRNMGVYFHTFSSAVWLGRQCVMALLIRPCNRPASSESACLSFLIAFNPVFWRKRRKNHWRKIHSHSEGSSSWLVPQKSHRDRWHLCNWLAKGLWDSSQCNLCSFLSWVNWSSCQKIHQTECKRWQFVSSMCFIPSFCTEVDFWRVVLLQNGSHKTLWF